MPAYRFVTGAGGVRQRPSMVRGVLRRQTGLRLTDGDRPAIDDIRSKGAPQSQEVNRAHVLSAPDSGVPQAQIMAALGMRRLSA